MGLSTQLVVQKHVSLQFSFTFAASDPKQKANSSCGAAPSDLHLQGKELSQQLGAPALSDLTMVRFSRYFLFQSFGAGKGRGSEKKSSAVGKKPTRSFGVIRKKDTETQGETVIRKVRAFEAARESGSLGTSRPAQPVEQVDRSDRKRPRVRWVHSFGNRQVPPRGPLSRSPPPALDAHSLRSQCGFARHALELLEIQKRRPMLCEVPA